MADETEETEDEAPKKKSKLPVILGLVLALALGGGGFFAVYSGLVLAPPDDGAHGDEPEKEAKPLPRVAFVPLDPLVVNLGGGSSNRHLKFHAQLEVVPATESEVTSMLPRVMDVLNGYLRAISVEEIEDRTALIRLRAQMLRRIQIVTGEGRVRDLLVMEFVLN